MMRCFAMGTTRVFGCLWYVEIPEKSLFACIHVDVGLLFGYVCWDRVELKLSMRILAWETVIRPL